MAGLYFDEFEIGQVFEHPIRRTVTEMDNVLFSTLTLNMQPLHIDFDFASKHGIRQAAGQQPLYARPHDRDFGRRHDAGTTVGNLGMTDVKFPHPVVPRRHGACALDGADQAREQIAADARNRRVQASGVQSEERRGGGLYAPGADAQEAGGLRWISR